MDSSNALQDIDEDKLREIIAVLKEGGVSQFRYGELELAFVIEEPDVPVGGFIPFKDRAGAQAQAAADDVEARDPYAKAFAGRKPTFSKPKG